ncbi:hypothetical protein D9615_009130 [Tricholomella constricta]|uniref:Uncharacterized protein n=1 Tax=Tricholomella constricta TaxID=117010 RepID=A0A8H5H0L3_9AGAR|nr:hypothetical protein D9615_009130 [Tricholomella constricta]
MHHYGVPDAATNDTSLLPLARFAHLHLQHILSHPPDSVLFPFLHGLEGDNHAQNTFFSSSSSSCSVPAKRGPTVPPYRGLVWVVCEDDLDAEPRRYARELAVLRRKRDGGFGDGASGGPGTPALEGDSENSSSDFDEDDDDDVDEEFGAEQGQPRGVRVDVVPPDAMDVDTERPGHRDAIDMDLVRAEDKGAGGEKHMHPVVQRPAPIQTANLPSSFSSASSGGLSTSFTTTASSSSDSDGFSFSPPFGTSPTPTPSTKPAETEMNSTNCPKPPSLAATQGPPSLNGNANGNALPNGITAKSPIPNTPNPDLALLTCSFRPCEILRRTKPKLSLDAQGRGEDKAGNGEGDADADEGWEFKTKAKSHPDLLNYNVFLLDATAADMQADTGVPHLVMRLCGGGVPGAPNASSPGCGDGVWGAHTDGTDGHLFDMDTAPAEEGRKDPADGMYVDLDAEMDLETGMDVDGVTGPSSHAHPSRRRRAKDRRRVQGAAREPNTVDFAQREKEEMCDLTKASEIISVFPPDEAEGYGYAHHIITPPHPQPSSVPSLHSLSPTTWAPHVGQVFLGNSEDVPLAPEVPSRFRSAAALGLIGSAEQQKTSSGGGDVEGEDTEDPFNYRATNDPARGFGYDICIECHDLAPFPSAAHLRAAEEHLAMLEVMWVNREMGREREREEEEREREREGREKQKGTEAGTQPRRISPRPPPNANAVIHLPFPSSPTNTHNAMNSLLPVIWFLQKWLAPVIPPQTPEPKAKPTPPPQTPPPPPPSTTSGLGSRRWSSVTALMPHFPSFPGSSSSSSSAPPAAPTMPTRTRSFTSPPGHPPPATPSATPPPVPTRTRPIKVLIYSADGYTESSVPALCLLMAVKRLALPEAYLELQVARRRSFFVYHADLGVLRRVEARLREDEERARVERERLERARMRVELNQNQNQSQSQNQDQDQDQDQDQGEAHGVNGNGKRVAPARAGWGEGWRQLPPPPSVPTPPPAQQQPLAGRPAAKSVSFAHAPPRSPPLVVPSQGYAMHNKFISGTPPAQQAQPVVAKGRPRANTSPWLPSLFGDHQSWFNDSRFDGSFPSRVLPFLYLGNLNHASNAYMLHALGITHVVSVGECALVPPPHHMHGHGHGQGAYHSTVPYQHPGPGAHYTPGKGPGQGSLWFEEREGRIKVLDIKGVCDDGIDTLEPQLEPICDWIDQARVEGGQVLVHCRVGVSRSATVTIAYVMKHLGLPLVDAYLIVRSRRLSVLIQPNMRLLYNLCGWEIKLAKARAGDDEDSLRKELARMLTWPYLAKEVHALNEKYLH